MCDRTLGLLRTAFARAMAPHNQLTSGAMTFLSSSHGSDLDPVVETIVRKVLLMRRVITKRPALATQARRIYDLYAALNCQGTSIDLPTLSSLEPALHQVRVPRRLGDPYFHHVVPWVYYFRHYMRTELV